VPPLTTTVPAPLRAALGGLDGRAMSVAAVRAATVEVQTGHVGPQLGVLFDEHEDVLLAEQVALTQAPAPA
jgi:hypothetical protein